MDPELEQYCRNNPEDPICTKYKRMQAQALRGQQSQQGGMSPGMAMKFIPQQGGGASGGGEALGGAGPMAALAAAVIANETYQNKSGNRPEDFGEHMKELATGEVLTRDAKRYLGDDIGELVGSHGNPKGMLKNIKRSLKPWEWF